MKLLAFVNRLVGWLMGYPEAGSEWRHVGTCDEGRAMWIGGVNVWEHEWVRVGDECVEVPHLAYEQEHRLAVYEVVAKGRVVRFAAGEFSANVWGFYVRGGDE